MYTKLLSLISQIIFYEVDLGVDFKVANQQRNLIFSDTLNIYGQANQLLNKTFYVHSYETPYRNLTMDEPVDYDLINIEYLYYEPMHFLLTATWLVLGGFFQSFVVLKNIQNQTYIPLIWKLAIIISSLFMMGPLFIYFFCIFVIITSDASIPEKKLILILVGFIIKQMN
jgi:hypothetical protein